MKKVLVHLSGGLGDIIMASPAIKSLAQSGYEVDLFIEADFQDTIDLYRSWSILHLATSDRSVIEQNTYDYYFAGWLVKDPAYFKNWLRSTVICASYELQFRQFISSVNMNLNYLKMIDPAIKISKETYAGYSSRHFPEISKNTVVLGPGCNSIYSIKRWDKFEELADRFEDVVVIGTEEDMNFNHSYFYPEWVKKVFRGYLGQSHYGKVKKLANALGRPYNHPPNFGPKVKNYIGQLNLADTAALLKQAGLFIGNDSGVAHLAAAVDLPTVMIFGPTSIESVRVERDNILYISKDLDCRPCQFGGKYPQSFRKGYVGCPIGVKCLTELSTNEIYKRSTEFWDECKARQ